MAGDHGADAAESAGHEVLDLAGALLFGHGESGVMKNPLNALLNLGGSQRCC